MWLFAESSSTGSSFPADVSKPVPLAVVSLDSRQMDGRIDGRTTDHQTQIFERRV